MTFKEKYLAGEIEFEAIDDYVEEDAWIVDGDEALKEMLDAGKQ